MIFDVVLSNSALSDLEEIYGYIGEHDSIEAAQYVVASILDVCDSLAELPSRGAHPTELQRLGILNYREIFFKPYRVLYAIADEGRVEVLLIADGRRDMQSLLTRRLLGH